MDTYSCSICLGTGNKSKFKKLKCGHKFHYECIEKWYLTNYDVTCPYCREPIDESYIYNYNYDVNEKKKFIKKTNNIRNKKLNNNFIKNIDFLLYNCNPTPQAWFNLFEKSNEYLLPLYKLELGDNFIKISLFLRLYILYSNDQNILAERLESFNQLIYYDINNVTINNLTKQDIIDLFDLSYEIMTILRKKYYINYLSIYNTFIMDIFMITIKELNLLYKKDYDSIIIITIKSLLNEIKLIGKIIPKHYFEDTYYENNLNNFKNISLFQKEYIKNNYIIY